MDFPFLQKSQAFAGHLLHKAGLTVSKIPQAFELARSTAETWFTQEKTHGNLNQALLVLKGQVQEKGPKLLYNQLKEMLLVRLMVQLGIRSALASNIAALILPFVLKQLYEQVSQNSNVQTWWKEQNWKQHLTKAERIKDKWKGMKEFIRPRKPPEN